MIALMQRGVALVALGAILAAATAAGAAQPPSSRAATTTHSTVYVVPVGETIVLKGTSIVCHVETSGGEPDLLCVKGTLAQPVNNSARWEISDATAKLWTAGTDTVSISSTHAEPAVSGATFVAVSRAPTTDLVSTALDFAVGSTHILCRTATAGKPHPGFGIECGVSSVAQSLQFAKNSYVLFGNDSAAQLAQVEPGGLLADATVDQPNAAPVATINSCLVGQWTETGETDEIEEDGTEITLSGGRGRRLAFTAAGTETADYTHSAPLVGTYEGRQLRLTTTGTVTFEDSTSGSRLTFRSADYAGSTETATYGGAPVELGRRTTPPPDTYACTSTTLTESANGYDARFTRS